MSYDVRGMIWLARTYARDIWDNETLIQNVDWHDAKNGFSVPKTGKDSIKSSTDSVFIHLPQHPVRSETD